MRYFNFSFPYRAWNKLVFLFLLLGPQAWSAQRFSVQGRILTADGKPLTASTVLFRIQVRSSGNEDCLLYQETQTLDMSSANGVFALTVGAGTRAAANVDGGNALDKVFSNSAALSLLSAPSACADASTSYTPGASDTRKLLISYNDGIVSDTFPVMGLNWIPQSLYSQDAGKLAGVEGAQYLRVTGATPAALSAASYNSLASLLSIPTCAAGEYLTIWSGVFACGTPAGGGGGGLSSVTSGNSYITVTNGSTAPVVTLNVGTSANTVAAGNDTRITGAIQGSAAPGGDLSGTYTSPTVAKIQNQSVSSTTPVGGQVLAYSGSSWTPTNFGIGNLKTNLGASQFASASCSDSQTLTWSSLTDVFSCAAIDNLDASRITAGTLDAARLPATVKYWQDGGSGKIYYNGGNVGIGTTNPGSKLTVHGGYADFGTDASNIVRISHGGAGSWGAIQSYVGGSSGTIAINPGGGNVGIGTSSPFYQTDIVRSASAAEFKGLFVNNSAGDTSAAATITLGATSDVTVNSGAGGNGIAKLNTLRQSDGSANLNFFVSPGGGPAPYQRMTILGASGNVGIGTASPASKLDVNGVVTATGFSGPMTSSGYSQTSGNFAMSGAGTFSTGTGAVALNGATTIAANQNFSMASGTGTFSQVYTGTGTASSLTANSVTSSDAASMTANGLTSGSILSLSSSSTSAAAGNTGLKVSLSGANTTAGITRTGISSSVTATGSTSTNVAGYFSASGGTNNYGLIVNGGNVGIGTTTPLQTLSLVAKPIDAWTTSNWPRSLIVNQGGTTGAIQFQSGSGTRGGIGHNGSSFYLITSSTDDASTTPGYPLYVTNSGSLSTGRVFVNDGGAVNPTYSFTSSSNTGMYYDGSNGIAFATNGNRRMTLDSSGNVGIGTTSPDKKLTVQGTVSVTASDSAYTSFAWGRNLELTHGGAIVWPIGASDRSWGIGKSTNPSSLYFFNSTADDNSAIANYVMTMNSSGNVGIGTTNPSAKLHLNADASEKGILVRASATTPGNLMEWQASDGTVAGNFALNNTTGGLLTLRQSGSTTVGLDGSNRRIYLGAAPLTGAAPGSSSAATLSVQTSSDRANVVIQGAVGQAAALTEWQNSGGSVLAVVSASGNVGIGTSTPSQKLHVAGNIYVQGTVANCTLGDGAGGTMCSSDARLKKDVHEISNSLEKILSLRGVEFIWNDKTQHENHPAIGVIAQEVEKQFPTAVTEDSKTGYKRVDYAVLVAPLIQAFKTIHHQVNELFISSEGHSRRLAFVEAENVIKDQEIQRLKKENMDIKSYLCSKDPAASLCR